MTHSITETDAPSNQVSFILDDALDMADMLTALALSEQVDVANDQSQYPAGFSPIDRIPYEILSEVFILRCQSEQFAPIVIGSVSRRFRETILATPLAWSRIFHQNKAGKPASPTYVSMFVERSHPCLLHVAFPPPCRRSIWGYPHTHLISCSCLGANILIEKSDRIGCLVIERRRLSEYLTRTFTNLGRLTITEGTQMIHPMHDMSYFPNLWYLDISGNSWLNDTLDFSTSSSPTLRHLALTADEEGLWTVLISTFAGSLVKLKVRFKNVSYPSNKWTITGPKLKCLVVIDGIMAQPKHSRLLAVRIPNLIFYEYYSKEGILSVEHTSGVDKVIQLRTNCGILLEAYSSLRFLQLELSPASYLDIVDQLERDTSCCPLLEAIELLIHRSTSEFVRHVIKQRISNRNKGFGSAINAICIRNWVNNPSMGSDVCGDVMACHGIGGPSKNWSPYS